MEYGGYGHQDDNHMFRHLMSEVEYLREHTLDLESQLADAQRGEKEAHMREKDALKQLKRSEKKRKHCDQCEVVQNLMCIDGDGRSSTAVPQSSTSDRDSSSSSSAKEESNDAPRAKIPANENPVMTSDGLVDGRSNARVAFDQKVQLLAEFKAKYGHIDISQGTKDTFKGLGDFIRRQRETYNALKDGRPSPMTEDRIRILEDLGISWKRTRWADNLNRLRAFNEEHGHCCVAAVRMAGKEVDPKLEHWVQRIISSMGSLRRAEAGLFVKEVTLERAHSHMTPERRSQLKELGCHYINTEHFAVVPSSKKKGDIKSEETKGEADQDKDETKEENEEDEAKGEIDQEEGETKGDDSEITKEKSYKVSTSWYFRLEELRAYKAKHGDCLVPTSKQTSGLGKWVNKQRKAYRKLQDGVTEGAPYLLEHNIRLLNEIGFEWDAEVSRLHFAAIQKTKLIEEAKEEAEAPKKRLEDAQKKVENTKGKVLELAREAKEAEKMARQALIDLKEETRRQKEAAGPIGQQVIVAPRGGDRGSGPAIITAFRGTMILGTESFFYDLEFLSDKKREKSVDGVFVTFPNAPSTPYRRPIRKPIVIEAPVTRTRSKKLKTANVQNPPSLPQGPLPAAVLRLQTRYPKKRHRPKATKPQSLPPVPPPAPPPAPATAVYPKVALPKAGTIRTRDGKIIKIAAPVLRTAPVPAPKPAAKYKARRVITGPRIAPFAVGGNVIVASRGGERRHGPAIVTGCRTAIVLGRELHFYDVEFVSDKKKEESVDGSFVFGRNPLWVSPGLKSAPPAAPAPAAISNPPTPGLTSVVPPPQSEGANISAQNENNETAKRQKT